MNPGLLRQRRRARRRIDEVAQNLAPKIRFARQRPLDRISQQAAPKFLVAPHPRPHRLTKIPHQRHQAIVNYIEPFNLKYDD
jgi:hypothetical protein